jgi:hypothetical protein
MKKGVGKRELGKNKKKTRKQKKTGKTRATRIQPKKRMATSAPGQRQVSARSAPGQRRAPSCVFFFFFFSVSASASIWCFVGLLFDLFVVISVLVFCYIDFYCGCCCCCCCCWQTQSTHNCSLPFRRRKKCLHKLKVRSGAAAAGGAAAGAEEEEEDQKREAELKEVKEWRD